MIAEGIESHREEETVLKKMKLTMLETLEGQIEGEAQAGIETETRILMIIVIEPVPGNELENEQKRGGNEGKTKIEMMRLRLTPGMNLLRITMSMRRLLKMIN